MGHTKDIIIRHEQTRELFTVEITDEGKYIAVRNEEPKFCFIGEHIVDVAARASIAFKHYKKMQRG